MKRTIKQSGVTLIELLIVATLTLMLMAISVPTIKPMLQSQATSNAAQTVSTYLNRARTRAMTSGRSCGVRFQIWTGTSASLVMQQVEVPPLFSGYTEDATASVTLTGSIASATFTEFPVIEYPTKVRFDYMGPFYTLNPGNTLTAPAGTLLPEKTNVAFELFRPAKATMTAPIGLPQGTIVELNFSGTDDASFLPGSDITIMFSPSGEVEKVEGAGITSIPSSPIYFLIGRWEKMDLLKLPEEVYNFADGNNFWVTIHPLTGVISTTEVNPTIAAAPPGYTGDAILYELNQSREFARQSKRNLGGH